MLGALPASAYRYRLDGTRTVAEALSPRPPGGAEVVVEVAGSAVGYAPGAEISGTVVAAGEAAAEWMGRRVVVPRLLPCGECDRCRRGRVAACRATAPRGGPATCETVPARYLLSVEPPLWPAGMELWQLCALADALSAPYAALARAGVAPGTAVAVLGAGVRGRLAARVASLLGAHTVVLEPDAERRRLAGERLDGIPLLEGEDPPATALAAIDRLLRESGTAAFDLTVVETSGRRASRGRAIELAARASGTALLLDGGDGLPVETDVESVASGEARLLGSAAAHPDLLPELAALVARGELRFERELAAIPFEALGEAIAARRAGTLDVLPVLVPSPALSSPAIDTGGSARS